VSEPLNPEREQRIRQPDGTFAVHKAPEAVSA
jgi:hypothetical protein